MADAVQGKDRKQWIDFLRGLAMLLVIWGHIDRSIGLYFLITSPFKMPMFFAITGYVFNDRDGNVKAFLKNLFFRIIIPWFILSLVWLKVILVCVNGHPDKIGGLLYDFFSGEDFWFMPCIIIAQCIFFVIRKFIRKNTAQYIVMAAVSVCGLIMTHFGVCRFALLDVACTAQLFILFGYWFRRREASILSAVSTAKLFILIAAYAALTVCSIFLFPDQRMDVHTNRYYSFWLCGLMILIGLLVWFVGAQRMKKFPRWLVFVGQNTLVFYIVHYHVRRAFSWGIDKTGLPFPQGIAGSIIEFVIVCLILTVISLIINKWLPFAAGRKRVKAAG